MEKIVIESHIPYMKGLLEPFAQVRYLESEDITPQAVRDAHVLLVRTRTRCDAQLLEGSSVRFIGTATIGTDHIDLDYCKHRGITVVNAPGCNAPAVAQWVHSSIAAWLVARDVPHHAALTLGIVGVGHVGKIVARWAQELGYRVLLNDPPRALEEGEEGFVPLDCIKAESDIITFHTPIVKQGRFATWHLCDDRFLHESSRCRLLLNAARGGICDNVALSRWNGDVAIDCWEHEPAIDLELLAKALIATPHIAGYSCDGKHRGTAMVVEAVNRHFGWNAHPLPAVAPAGGAEHVTLEKIRASYDPLHDTQLLKSTPGDFEKLRNSYPLRDEVLS